MRADLKWLEDPEVFRVNRLDAHSDHHFYECMEDLEQGCETLRQSLDGSWKFRWSQNPGERPADFFREDFELEDFGTIQVPSHMELQGFDRIQYINNIYPWEGHTFLRPPHIDWEYNPVGSYVKFFDLEKSLQGKRVCISFQGVEQAMYVWLNGVFIGYGEDSFTPSEFDLTDVIREKNNRLCVEVYKRSSAAWLEDQDFFRFSGIFREVYLYAKPELHVEDLWAKAGLLEDCETGTLELEVKISSDAGVLGAFRESDREQETETGKTGQEIQKSRPQGTGQAWQDIQGSRLPEPGENGQKGQEPGNTGVQIFWELQDANGRTVQNGELKKTERKEGFCFDITGRNHFLEGDTAGETAECPAEAAAHRTETAESPAEAAGIWALPETVKLPQVCKWEVKAPYLYRLILQVFEGKGKLAEAVPCFVGFRRFEIKNRIMCLNGKRLEICGVNRHEWNPRTGRAITEGDMRKDIELLKKNNINAVRTCHYPNQSLWYQLCDENGILVMDEANLESHGSWQKLGQCEPSWNVPGSKPEWEACVVDRAASMLERDKNHPSILWWSCGNESYAGDCILAMSRYFHEKDPSRLVHYEGVFWNRQYHEISDVESRMYAPPQEIRTYLENQPEKPFLLCEYMHDMGNSIGGMESYMELLDEFPMYQGGFIWDYVDQAIYHKLPDGREALGYGGDFGDRPTDYSFSGNGILFADRTEKPAMQEVRYWYSSREERESRQAENQRLRREAERQLAVEQEVHAQKKIQIRTEKERTKNERTENEGGGYLQLIHGDQYLGIKGDGFHFIFSYTEGGPISLVYEGKECLYRAPRPAFWRASTENDKGNGFAVKSAVWAAADLYAGLKSCGVKEMAENRTDILEVQDLAGRKQAARDIEKVQISYVFVTPTVPETEVEIVYTVEKNGRIQVDMHYHGKPGLPQLPLFGLRFVMPSLEKTVTWQGLSGETYPDRKAGGKFGIQESRIAVPDYLVPQECGNHADTCWMEVGNLRFVMKEEPFQFSVLPYTAAELENALHKEELPPPRRTVINILARMRGVGGINSWGADVEPRYHISAEEDIRFSFYITAHLPGKADR